MNRAKLSRIVVAPVVLLILTLLLTNVSPAGPASKANTPQYSSYLSPTTANSTTYRVTLTITNLMGSTPPSSRWYGPEGSQVSAGCKSGTVVRDYDYASGSLYQVKDYFYISGCSREPGAYRVKVGIDINKGFTIVSKKYYGYLPMVYRPYTEPDPPGAFVKTSPTDGATDLPLVVTLDWEESTGAESYAYCYDTNDDDACTSWVDTGTTSQADLTGVSPDTSFYWQVRASNSAGTTYADGGATDYWSFATGSGVVSATEMIEIAAGAFEMGCDPDHFLGLDCPSSWLPLHTVSLDAYRIDETEVTNAQYASCVMAGECTAPSDSSSFTRTSYYGNLAYDDYPVVFVTWQDAYDYCAWAGKRLPTEAEWERAARGTSLRTYPWGDAAPTCTLVNFSQSYSSQCVGDTNAVGSYPTGASPDGLLDMSGNVEEWVNDWFGSDYYESSPGSNPPGPASGEYRVVRGGGYGNMDQDITTAGRTYDSRGKTDHLGFRCAADPDN